MIELANKLQVFNKMVYQSVKETSTATLMAKGEENTQILQEAEKRLGEERQRYIDRRVALANEKYREKLSSYRENARTQLLARNSRFVDEVIALLKEKYAAYRREPDYGKRLNAAVAEALDALKVEGLELLVLPEDEVLLTKKVVDRFTRILPLELSSGGGFAIHHPEKAYRLDRTIERRIEEERYAIGMAIDKALAEGAML